MSWQTEVLDALHAPASDENVQILTLWAQSEGTPPEWNNWLATTREWPGAVAVNSAGVKHYPSEADGVAATVDTLRLHYYVQVVYALTQDKGRAEVFAAINQSPWCSGCQGGHYPIRLWEWVNSTAHDPAHVSGANEQIANVADAAAHPSGGAYVLGRDGGVFSFHGAPFFGSYPGLPDEAKQGERTEFDSMVVHPNGDGYTITDKGGESYSFPYNP